MKYRRIKRHISPQVKALADAQKIAFAPLTFQAVAAMLKFGILEFLDEILLLFNRLLKTVMCQNILPKLCLKLPVPQGLL